MYNLDFQNINDDQSIDKYNNTLKEFKKCSTFYSLQYYNYSLKNNLSYFVLTKNEKPLILLPIYLNKIESEILDSKDIFYDAISPYGYSGPLFNELVNENDIKIFWNQVDNWYKNNNVVTEFVRFNLEHNHKQYSGHLIPSLNNVNGKIKDFQFIWDGFKQKVRNNYRKAESNNLRIVINSDKKSIDDIAVFYDIYIKTMVRNEATENFFYPKSYFENLINFNQNKIILVFVYKDANPISTELLISNNNYLYSYLGGTLSDYFKYRPNDFLKIEIIKWAIAHKKTNYILGGGRENDDGLYQYKKAFFPKDDDVIFYTGRKIINQKIYDKLTKAVKFNSSKTDDLPINPKKYFPKYRKMNTQNAPSFTIISEKPKWDIALKKVDNYDFYHTYDYHNLSKLENEHAILIEYTEENKKIYLPLIKRKIPNSDFFDATSVYGYAGPIHKNIDSSFDNKKFIEQLNIFLKEEKIVSVFSRLNPFIENQNFSINGIGKIIELGSVVNIDLTKNVDDQRTIFSKTTKRYLNKCRKLCDVKISKEEEDINTFIDLYYENMDRVNAKKEYYFSKKYFFDFINSEDYETDVVFAIDKETKEIISAAMMVKTNKIIQYHISGTKNNYLNLSPIRLLIDEMRLQGTQNNYTYFNLGGGLGNNEDELFRFKSSFSKDFKTFSIWKLIAMPGVYSNLVNKKDISDPNINFFPLYRYEEAKS